MTHKKLPLASVLALSLSLLVACDSDHDHEPHDVIAADSTADVVNAASIFPADPWELVPDMQKRLDKNFADYESVAGLISENVSLSEISASDSAPSLGAQGRYGAYDQAAIDAFEPIQSFVKDENIVSVWSHRYAESAEKTLAHISFVLTSETNDGLLEELYINKYVDPDVTDIEIRANSCRPLEQANWYMCIRR